MSAHESKTVSFGIEGMSCDGCANSIERVLGRIPGVRESNVTFKSKEAVVTFDPSRADEGSLMAAITKAGYTPVAK